VKTKIAEIIAVAAVILICIAFAAASITWGLPSAERNMLYFTSRESLQNHLAKLKPEYVEQSYKTFDNYRLQHPGEKIDKLPRSFYNPIRSYHPDEYLPVKMLSQVKPRALDFDTKIYTLGGAYVYLLGAVLFVAKATGLIHVTGTLAVYFHRPELMAHIFIVGRCLTLVFFAGLLIFTYLTARELAGRGTALFAAAAVGTAPLVTLNARYMYVDIPALFYLAASLYFSIRLTKQGKLRNYVLAGVFGGLAAGTKIQCGLVAVIVWLAHVTAQARKGGEGRTRGGKILAAFLDRNLLVAAACFIAAFVVTNPYCVLKPRDYFFDLARHAPHRIIPELYLKALWAGMGPVAFVSALAAVTASAFMKDRRIALLSLWAVVFVGFMSRYGHFFARFALPAVPALFVLLAAVSARLKARRPKLQYLFFLPAAAILAWNVSWCASLTKLMRGTDVRTEAGLWIRRHIPKGASVGAVSDPWQYEMPPFDLLRYRLVLTGKDGRLLAEKRPDWFIASSPQYAHDLQFPEGPAYKNFWRLLYKGDYKPVQTFDRAQEFAGFRFNRLNFPDDLRNYVNPEIVVFKRKR